MERKGQMSEEKQTPSLKYDAEMERHAPNISVVDQNPTRGYSEDYNNEQEQQHRVAFAMEVERAYIEQQKRLRA